MKFIATIISSIIILSSLTMVQADEKKQKNLEAVAKEIKAAVKAGKITEKEAKAKFTALKKQGHEKKGPSLAEWIKKIQIYFIYFLLQFGLQLLKIQKK